MSNDFKGFLGKDGQRYDNMLDMLIADRVVDNSLKQTELLQKQVEQKEEELKQARRQEIKQEIQRRLDKEEQEEEENNRIERLCDKISIPHKVFIKFKEKLFSYEITDIDKEKIEKTILSLDISNLDKEEYKRLLPVTIEHIEDGSLETQPWIYIKRHFTEVLSSPSDKYKDTKEYKKLQDFINNRVIKNLEVTDFQIFEDNEDMIFWYNEIQKENKGFNENIIMTILLVILCAIGIPIFKITFYTIFSLIMLLFSSLATLAYSVTRTNNINALVYSINQYLNGNTEKQKDKQEKMIFNKTTTIEEEYKKLKKEKVDRRLSQFYDFRIHHYNIEIETLLYSSGLVEECEENNFSFKAIDKNNILGEGTIEDYFFYFSQYKVEN